VLGPTASPTSPTNMTDLTHIALRTRVRNLCVCDEGQLFARLQELLRRSPDQTDNRQGSATVPPMGSAANKTATTAKTEG